MSNVITLTTDFGISDAYVPVMKGVILGINPSARIVDICHTIKPQNIFQAAFIIGTAYKFFPKGSVHVVVVDPGVGTGRRGIVLQTPDATFVAPDNGVLTYILREFRERSEISPVDRQEIALSSEVMVVSLTEPRFWRNPVSPTFHGRDVFAPVAAHLSLGIPPEEIGEVIELAVTLPLPEPERSGEGFFIGHVIHIDNFGNIVTDIRGDDLPSLDITVEIGGSSVSGLSRTYADRSGLLTIIDSFGYLEVSLRNGSAASFLNVKIGNEVKVKF